MYKRSEPCTESGLLTDLEGGLVRENESLFDVSDLLSDDEKCLYVPVQLALVLTLCGLYHQSIAHRPRHCRCMQT